MIQETGIISTPPPDQGLDDPDDTGAELELRQIAVGTAFHGIRIDKALADSVPEFSRSYLRQLLEAGGVSLNGQAVSKASHKLKAGDAVTLELRPTPQSQAFRPEAIPLEIVFEDAHLLVLNKPAGLVVHPAPGNWSGTLLNGLLAHAPEFAEVPRAGIVHRLDKDTSGLMVVARHRQAMDALVGAIAARSVSRQYLALAPGRWQGGPERTVEAAIGRDPRNRLRMAAVDLLQHAGKPARTDFVLLAQSASGVLVRCILHTGRTHQIRVHMATLGLPLLGDSLYGGSLAAGMERQALHAERLAFTHPITGQALQFRAPVPADMASALAAWGLRYNSPHG